MPGWNPWFIFYNKTMFCKSKKNSIRGTHFFGRLFLRGLITSWVALQHSKEYHDFCHNMTLMLKVSLLPSRCFSIPLDTRRSSSPLGATLERWFIGTVIIFVWLSFGVYWYIYKWNCSFMILMILMEMVLALNSSKMTHAQGPKCWCSVKSTLFSGGLQLRGKMWL